MGFLDKVKNLFTEEVDEEEVKPQKKEVKPVEVSLPKRENVIKREPAVIDDEEEISVADNKLVDEPKDKFVFPVYFDDKDFDDLEKPKTKEKPKKVEEPVKESKKEPYQGAKVTIEPEPKKVFKPSPIISPVYGILDKNYSKDDITTKQEKRNNDIIRSARPENLTIDDIRNKAYGTLEDDLETTMSFDLSEINDKPKHEESNHEALEIFNELNFEEMEPQHADTSFEELEKSILLEKEEVIDDDTEELARQLEEQKKKLEEISQYINENEVKTEVTVPEEELERIDYEDIQETVVESHNEDTNLNDSELFDLIDSMYEKKEDD